MARNVGEIKCIDPNFAMDIVEAIAETRGQAISDLETMGEAKKQITPEQDILYRAIEKEIKELKEEIEHYSGLIRDVRSISFCKTRYEGKLGLWE